MASPNAMRAASAEAPRSRTLPNLSIAISAAPFVRFLASSSSSTRSACRVSGGWVVARYQLQVSSSLYWASITKGLYMNDVWMGLSKPFVFGFLIVTIACHVGLRTTGGTAGVGLEYGFAPNWSAAIEYDHIFESRHNVSFITAAGVPLASIYSSGGDTDLVTVRVNYRWGGPVIAKY